MEVYSIMDWVTLGGIVTTIGAVLTLLITTLRDNKAVLREFEAQSKEHDTLSEKIKDKSSDLKEKTLSIKGDTEYICNELRTEQKARENLYDNTTRASEILETIDIMREVVIQNSKLNAEVAELKVKNQKLLVQKDDKYSKLLDAIGRFKTQLAEFEMYGESEDIRFTLRKIENELSEYVDWMYKWILYIFVLKSLLRILVGFLKHVELCFKLKKWGKKYE